MPRDFLDVTVRGLREVDAALRGLPADGKREMRKGAVKLSRSLANAVRAAGRASDRQSSVASRTVRTQTQGNNPSIIAGPHPLLFGSEFGVLGRFGWYRKGRYHSTVSRQFRHRNPTGYWFFPTQEREAPRIREELQAIADAVIRDWPA